MEVGRNHLTCSCRITKEIVKHRRVHAYQTDSRYDDRNDKASFEARTHGHPLIVLVHVYCFRLVSRHVETVKLTASSNQT